MRLPNSTLCDYLTVRYAIAIVVLSTVILFSDRPILALVLLSTAEVALSKNIE
ncbi:hypothetical protein [Nostoc sp. UHCC 0870]|uniref:hypothetical protein n=1 Tax=Nostoc sp. UHCC 0870 TaxID=2914041 RepID=UPI001EDE61E1|nr:hypothetical protein [Nostoc sp. UHCC 0870]UKO98983.1 hypothetical protein L6494_04430 [Nostoc sp. UHCC 0870]